MQEFFHPRPADSADLDAQPVKPPSPLEQPEVTKAPLLQRLLPIVMLVAMVGMIAMIVVGGGMGGGRMSPMMMMMPIMMLMGVASMLGNAAGGGNKDLDTSRKNHALALREERKKVHIQGGKMYATQQNSFPQPQQLAQLVGTDQPDMPSMWTIRHDDQGGFVVKPGTPDARDYRPYLAARIGRGTVMLDPELIIEEQPISDHLEPVTLGFFRKFIRTQRFVPGFPIAYHLGRRPFHEIVGGERALPLVRAMIANLAFNHAPDSLRLVLVTDTPEDPQWSAFKWLPHAHDLTRSTASGPRRSIYRSMREFGEDWDEFLSGRGIFTWPQRKDFTPPHVMVIVDLPDAEVRLPENISARGAESVSILVARAASNTLPKHTETTLYVDEDGDVSREGEPDLASADALSVVDFDVFCRSMAGYRAAGSIESLDAPVRTDRPREMSYFEALEITDLDALDPRVEWAKNEDDPHLIIPIGNVVDDETGKATGEIVHLDLVEASIGGHGPSGPVQGMTGSGKSFLLRPIVLSLIRRYSPDRVNFILCDFKGGATFNGFDKLPHVLASITNLASEADMLARMSDVLNGEITYRQELITKRAGCEDILDYREVRKKKPELGLPALPHLVIIADEYRELVTKHAEYAKVFESVAQVGRSMGLVFMPASQFIDDSVIGRIRANITFGISLLVEEPGPSNVVIKTDAATRLPFGKGDAYFYKRVDKSLTRFRGFNVTDHYVPPAIAGSAAVGVPAAALDSAPVGTSLVPFTALNPVDDGGILDAEIVDEIDLGAAEPEDDPTQVRYALFDRLSRFQDAQPLRRLWLPTMKAPFSFAGLTIPAINSTELKFRIGDLDDPRNHRRVPYVITPNDAAAHIRVVGSSGSGCSTTLQAIIAAAAISYTPDLVNFYIIDCGGKMQEVAEFPNVGAYARRADTEMIDRILGEVSQIIAVRDQEMGVRNVASYAAYAESKQAQPVDRDPYGHMFIVIDGIQRYLSDDESGGRTSQLLKLANDGQALGIHLMVAGGPETTHHKLDQVFGTFIQHYVNDPQKIIGVTMQRETKLSLATLPASQPGRSIELVSGLQARIVVPSNETLGPIPGSDPDNPDYAFRADHSAAIRELGAALSAGYTQRAPQIQTVPSVLHWNVMWDWYLGVRAAGEQTLPMGASSEDLRMVALPNRKLGKPAPHLMIVGDRQSGRTSMIRFLLMAIMSQYTPDQAQIYLIDPEYNLLNERTTLQRCGLLAGYANDKAATTALVDEVNKLILDRQPSPSMEMTPTIMRERSWYSGPEIFVIADPINSLLGEGFGDAGVIGGLRTALSVTQDVGLHVFATASTIGFSSNKDNKPFYKALYGENSPYTLLLSGASNEAVFGDMRSGNQVRFTKRRPGLGQLYHPSQGSHPVIQTPFTAEWADPDQQ